jgi:hypothetical protein
MERENMDTESRVRKIVMSVKPSKDDPTGSYTGKPINPNEKPVQDSDDL